MGNRAGRRGASTETRPLEAVIYTRVSGKEQEREGQSLPAQLADTRRYAEAMGWAILGEYKDVLRGTRDDRPDYQAMLADVRRYRAEGRPVVVVAKWLHRLGRKLLESIRAREELKALGVAVHSVAEGGEVDDLRANIMGSVAQYEVQQLGERVAAVLEHMTENGWPKPGRATWGYRMRPATAEERALGAPKGVLDIDPAQAPYVRELFQRAAAGEPMRSLARWAAGLPPEATGGRALSKDTVKVLLKSTTYIARHPGDELEAVLARPIGRWPALVSDEDWAAVQDHTRRSGRKLARQASGEYLLTGMVKCPRCGTGMVGRHLKAGAAGPRYACPGSPTQSCTYTCAALAVNEAVLAQVGKVLDVAASDTRVLTAARKSWSKLSANSSTASKKLAAIDTRIATIERRLKNARLALVDELMTREQYVSDSAEWHAALTAAQKERDALTADEAEVIDFDDALAAAGGVSVALQGGGPGRREELRRLIERVEPVRLAARGEYDAKIKWTPLGDALRGIAEVL